MKRDMEVAPGVQDALTLDRQVAETIAEAYFRGKYDRTLDKLSTDEIREKKKLLEAKTFQTESVAALIKVYDTELAIRNKKQPNQKVAEENKEYIELEIHGFRAPYMAAARENFIP